MQKFSKNYGKFEQGNKLSLTEWQACICNDYPGTSSDIVRREIFPKIKELVRLSIIAAKPALCASTFPKSFELLGYDFMIDDQFRPFLIEVNSNPCLELCSPLLAELIPNLINNVITLCVDPIFQPAPLPPGMKSGDASTPCYTSGTEEALRLIAQENNLFEELVV